MNSTDKFTAQPRRRFFLLVAAVSFGLAILKHFRGSDHIAAAWGIFGGTLLIVEFAAPKISQRLFAGWMRFAQILGTINTAIIVTVFYFVVLTPVGIIRRALGKGKPATLHAKKAKSNFLPLPPLPDGNTGIEGYYKPY